MQSYSKEGQDILVSSLIKEPGFFLDIGCSGPIKDNNTYLLEQNGWKGVLIDGNLESILKCQKERTSQNIIHANIDGLDWKSLLSYCKAPKIIDYISLDVDDANVNVIQNFPFDEYQFKILTYETDKYNCGTIRQDAAKEVLSKYPQYDLLLEDAQLEDGRPWEDWWYNKDYFSHDNYIVWDMKSKNKYWKDFLTQLNSIS